MTRSARTDVGNIPYHVLNRAVGRATIFTTPREYQSFIDLLADAKAEIDMRILAFTLMPNHWHLELYPKEDGDMGIFMHRLTNAHTRRVHADTGTTGTGPLYQGRYKSFMIEDDTHLLTVTKYIERNPVRAKLVGRCEDWRWGSAWLRKYGTPEQVVALLDDLLMDVPRDYRRWVNTPDQEYDLEQLRNAVKRGTPFGRESWVDRMVKRHELQTTVRREGRPKKTG